MIFDRIKKFMFGDKTENTEIPHCDAPESDSKGTADLPTFQYVHTAANRNKSCSTENDVLVLWWISNKKKGYDTTTKKYPKWFANTYQIDFDKSTQEFIAQGCLALTDGVVQITSEGLTKIKEYGYVVYVHEHPQYQLSINDFKKADNLHTIKNQDIAWGVFNSRVIEYTRRGMWESLSANYANMADLLIEEERYDQALDYIFATSFLETSGMRDGNELTPISTVYTKSGTKQKRLDNGMPDIFLMEINNYYVTAPFLKVNKHLNLDWTSVRERYLSSILIGSLERILPFRYFEKDESFEIFKEAIEASGTKGVFRIENVSRKLKTNKPDEHSVKYFYASVENKVNRMYN